MIYNIRLFINTVHICLTFLIISIPTYECSLLFEETNLCITSITEKDCNKDSILVSIKDNCPRCRTGAKHCETCEQTENCAPGLKCNQIKQCVYDTSTCHHLNHLPVQIQWVPNCEPIGHFTAKQCRGNKVSGRCFCFNNEGNKIFGWDWRVTETNMTCACSQYRARLEANGRQDVIQHCSQNGNFEEVQCDRDICWCADPLTGAVIDNTIMVPMTMWKVLPCCKSIFTYYCNNYVVVFLRIVSLISFSYGAINFLIFSKDVLNFR